MLETSQQKISDYESIHSVSPLCLIKKVESSENK